MVVGGGGGGHEKEDTFFIGACVLCTIDCGHAMAMPPVPRHAETRDSVPDLWAPSTPKRAGI